MKHLNGFNEGFEDDAMTSRMFDGSCNEYLMVLNMESGDEIHLSILEMSHYQHISSLIGSGYPGDIQGEQLSDYIISNRIDKLMCQTYVLEDYSFSEYNIVKVIHIPDLGC